jgi:hypothetical protein
MRRGAAAWPILLLPILACHVFQDAAEIPPPFDDQPVLCRSSAASDRRNHCRLDTLGGWSCEIQRSCEVDNQEVACIRGEPTTRSGTCVRVRTRARRINDIGDGPVSLEARTGEWGVFVIASEDSGSRETRVGTLEVSDIFSDRSAIPLRTVGRRPWAPQDDMAPWLVVQENISDPATQRFDVLRASCQPDSGYERLAYRPCHAVANELEIMDRGVLSIGPSECAEGRGQAGLPRNLCDGLTSDSSALFVADGQFELQKEDQSHAVDGFADAIFNGGQTLVVRPKDRDTAHLETWHPVHGQRSFEGRAAVATNADPRGRVAVDFLPGSEHSSSRDVGAYFVAYSPNVVVPGLAIVMFSVDGGAGVAWKRPRVVPDQMAPFDVTAFPGGFVLGSTRFDGESASFHGDFFNVEGTRVFETTVPMNSVFAEATSPISSANLDLLEMASLRFGEDLVVGALFRSGGVTAWLGWMVHGIYSDQEG